MATGGDPLAGGPPPSPPEPGRRKIKCEFCECELGGSGEYKSLSDEAKRLRGLKETNEKLEGTIATLRQEIEDLKARVPQAVPARSSGW